MGDIIRIGTRKSILAMEQTRLIAELIKEKYPDIQVEYVTRDTLGDRILDHPLQSFGGKGVFVSEFEQAIAGDVMELAVHSAKDLPMELAEGLTIAAVSEREDPRDVLVTRKGVCQRELEHFTIGTSSLRRQLQIGLLWEELWPDLHGSAGKPPALSCADLRGNVNTRLQKLEDGMFHGIILAAAGLKRLGIRSDGRYDFHFLPADRFIPAGGQGIMAVEGKEGSMASLLCKAIDHQEARMCLELERSVLKGLMAGCHEPVGIYSRICKDRIEVWGVNRWNGRLRQIHLIGENTDTERGGLVREAVKGLR